MEAMSPAEKLSLLEQNPDLTQEEIDEYERLLSERFTIDPDRVSFEAGPEKRIEREEQIARLYYRIYGGAEV